MSNRFGAWSLFGRKGQLGSVAVGNILMLLMKPSAAQGGKIDIRSIRPEERAGMIRRFGSAKRQMLAEKLETPPEFHQARDMGFAYFQGYFFCRPEAVMGREVPASQLHYWPRNFASVTRRSPRTGGRRCSGRKRSQAPSEPRSHQRSAVSHQPSGKTRPGIPALYALQPGRGRPGLRGKKVVQRFWFG